MNNYLKQEIESKLLIMGGAEFQSLCDSMLYHIYHESLSIYTRIGHQLCKSKTISGTPDTFFYLKNNGIVFVEATTKSANIIQKLEGDILSCIDKAKIDVGTFSVDRIILCYNNRIDANAMIKLQELVKGDIIIEHYGIDRIVETILYYQPWLAENLNLSVNKPGVYSLDKFIECYNVSALKFSSPLHTKFVCREDEFAEMEKKLNEKDILLVEGDAGIGKTKLVVEFLKRRFENNRQTNVIVLDEQATDIENSILPMLSEDKECIVFIDDVNRRTSLLDQLSQLQSSNKGKIKIVLTIRGYAFQEFALSYPKISEHTLHLKPLPDYWINEILKSKPYEIKNLVYLERIENISKGNVRIAVMCAELAVKENGLSNLIKDVPSLYDAFFSEHKRKLSDRDYKILCACSIFRCLRQGDQSTNAILDYCQITNAEFADSLSHLKDNECVDIWSFQDGKAIKIVDQVFSTYLVYDSVFKNQMFSLIKILDVFFHAYKRTIIDSIGGVLTSYHNSMVVKNLTESVKKYAAMVKSNGELYEEAIDTFGFYFPEEALAYYDEMVLKITKKDSRIFSTEYNQNDVSINQDYIITQLIQYFNHENDVSNYAFEILYDYCDRCPEKLPELIYWIGKKVLYTKDDYLYGLGRLKNFVEHLFNCMSKYNCCIPLFFSIARTMLEYRFSTDVLRGHSFVISQYTLIKDEHVVAIRKMIVDKLIELNSSYHSQVMGVIKSYDLCHEEDAKELVAYDIDYLCSVVSEICSPDLFLDVLVANRLCCFAENIFGSDDYRVVELKKKFRIDKYVRYNALNFHMIRGRHSYEVEDMWHEKQSELQEYFLLHTESDVFALIEELKEFSKYWDNNHVYESVILIVALNFANDYAIGQLLIESILDCFPDIVEKGSWEIVFNKVWVKGYYRNLLNTLSEYKGDKKYSLLYKYCDFYNIKKPIHVEQCVCDCIKEAIARIDCDIQIQLERLVIFGNVADFMEIIYNHNENSKSVIKIYSHGFCNKDYFSSNIDLAIRTFKQQKDIDHNFDYDNTIIKWLYKWSQVSFVGLFDHLIEKDFDISLSFIFSDEYDFEYVNSLIEKLINNYWHKEISIQNFFKEITDSNTKNNAYNFICRYIDLNIGNQDAVSIIIDASRLLGIDIHDEFLLYYLNHYPSDQSIENFDFCTDRSFCYSGTTTYGDIVEKELIAVLNVVNKVTDIRRRNKIIRLIRVY